MRTPLNDSEVPVSWFALGSHRSESGARPVLVVEHGMFDLQGHAERIGYSALATVAAQGLHTIMECWPELGADVLALAERAKTERDGLSPIPDETRFAAPFRPARIFAAASNYVEHANEMGTALAGKADSAPYIFIKASSSVIGPGEAIVLPPMAERVDWEVELAAVIGRGGRNIPVEQALAHVAGYTVFNDVSARDLTRRNDFPFKFDWFQGKSFDTFGPLGPWIVPAAVIGDPQNLRLTLTLNDRVMQDDTTGAMIFNIAEQISYLSSILMLRPGDVIATGTPNGVGLGHGVFLKPGDTVCARIEKIGSLTNPVEAAPSCEMATVLAPKSGSKP